MFEAKVWLALVVTLLAAGCDKPRVLTTAGSDIPRKVVVRKDSTPLFRSGRLESIDQFANQWEIYFITGESEKYFRVSGTADEPHDPSYFIRRGDAVEWNTYFCLTFADSPHQTQRNRVAIYRNLAGARDGTGDTVLIEKPFHSASWQSPQPILREYESRLYHIVSLYDDIDSTGNYVFLGNYAFGYVKHNDDAHLLLRYVSREQLDRHVGLMLASQYRTKESMSPSELNSFWGPLKELLAGFGSRESGGVQDLIAVFEDGQIPNEIQRGPFDRRRLTNPYVVRAELGETAKRMIEFLQDDSRWNSNGYGYVAVEWLPEPRR